MNTIAIIIINIGIYTIVIIGINNYSFGRAGLWMLGHIGFFGLSSLVASLCILSFGMPPFLGFTTGILAAAFAALVLFPLFIKLRGEMYILGALAFSEIVRALHIQLYGPSGVSHVWARPPLLNSHGDWSFILFVILPCLAISILITHLYSKLSIDRMAAIVREDDTAAELMGVNSHRIRHIFFVWGGFFGGLAGVIHLMYSGGTDPNMLGIYLSALLFCLGLVGGVNSLKGSIIGAILYVVLPRVIEEIARYIISEANITAGVYILYGVIIITILRRYPKGMFGQGNHLLRST